MARKVTFLKKKNRILTQVFIFGMTPQTVKDSHVHHSIIRVSL